MNDIAKYLYMKHWFQPSSNAEGDLKVLVRLYGCIGCTQKKIEKFIPKELQESFSGEFNVLFRIGKVESLPFSLCKTFVIADDQGEVALDCIDVKSMKLPTSIYMIVSTPCEDFHNVEDVNSASRRINLVVSLLRVILGNEVAYKAAYEFMLNVNTGDMTTFSEIISLPKEINNPKLNHDSFSDLKDIRQKLEKLKNSELQRSLLISFDWFEKASQEEVHKRFILYWIAIDALKGGWKVKLTEEFCKIYEECPDIRTINEKLGIIKLNYIRNNYFHDGVTYSLTDQRQERYIQLLFLDLLRYKLELPPRYHALGYIEAGFDINVFDTHN